MVFVETYKLIAIILLKKTTIVALNLGLIYRPLLSSYIANEITRIDGGFDSSRDFSRVDSVLFETLINRSLVLVDIANKIPPSGSGFDSSRDFSCVEVSCLRH